LVLKKREEKSERKKEGKKGKRSWRKKEGKKGKRSWRKKDQAPDRVRSK